VAILAYSDFDCDLCASYAAAIKEIRDHHPEEVSYTFRPFPLTEVHPKAAQAAAAFLAAPDEESAYAIHDLLFNQRDEWKGLSPSDFQVWLATLASEVGHDRDEFSAHLTSVETEGHLKERIQHAQASGVPGVPYILINHSAYLLGADVANMEAAVRLELLRARQLPPPDFQSPGEPPRFITLQLNQGAVVLQLLPEQAPMAVTSFVYLSENGWYDGSGFYRVIPGKWAEAGDPSGTGLGDPGYHFERELSEEMEFNQTGLVGLVNDGPRTNGSRFFITLEPRPDLSGSATLFARVVSGLEILEAQPAHEPLADPFQPATLQIESVEIGDR
jgi:cyclophilin family peptidyl-prolyl cis-trans isomerase